jgi:hypothetical protein
MLLSLLICYMLASAEKNFEVRVVNEFDMLYVICYMFYVICYIFYVIDINSTSYSTIIATPTLNLLHQSPLYTSVTPLLSHYSHYLPPLPTYPHYSPTTYPLPLPSLLPITTPRWVKRLTLSSWARTRKGRCGSAGGLC